MQLIISGYSLEGSPSIAQYVVSENPMCAREVWSDTPASPSFACKAEDMLFAGLEHSSGGEIILYTPDKNGYVEADRIHIEGGELCHLSYASERKVLYGSCYQNGHVAAVRVDGGHFVSCTEIFEQSGEGSRAHCCVTSPDGGYVYAVNIAQDRIYCYLPGDHGTLVTNGAFPYAQLAKGEGPRHICFHPTQPRLYLVTEYSSRIYVFSYDKKTGALCALEDCSALPSGFAGKSFGSGIAVSADGTRLYAGNRGADTISVFATDSQGTGKLEKLQDASCCGLIPRHIALSKDGHYLFSANQTSNEVVLIRIKEDGSLGEGALAIPFANPSYIEDITE